MSHGSNQHGVEFQVIYFMIESEQLINSSLGTGSELFPWAPSQEAYLTQTCAVLCHGKQHGQGH